MIIYLNTHNQYAQYLHKWNKSQFNKKIRCTTTIDIKRISFYIPFSPACRWECQFFIISLHNFMGKKSKLWTFLLCVWIEVDKRQLYDNTKESEQSIYGIIECLLIHKSGKQTFFSYCVWMCGKMSLLRSHTREAWKCNHIWDIKNFCAFKLR